MKFACLHLAVMLTLVALSAAAQTSLPTPPASAPASAARAGPRLLSPAELRDSASPPGDLRPEDRVQPQISIPLGRKPPASSKPASRVQRPNTAPAAGGIDDASARCEAEADAQLRAKCRARLTHAGTAR